MIFLKVEGEFFLIHLIFERSKVSSISGCNQETKSPWVKSPHLEADRGEACKRSGRSSTFEWLG